MFCYQCSGVKLVWDWKIKKWIAPYIDGAIYCDCPCVGIDIV